MHDHKAGHISPRAGRHELYDNRFVLDLDTYIDRMQMTPRSVSWRESKDKRIRSRLHSTVDLLPANFLRLCEDCEQLLDERFTAVNIFRAPPMRYTAGPGLPKNDQRYGLEALSCTIGGLGAVPGSSLSLRPSLPRTPTLTLTGRLLRVKHYLRFICRRFFICDAEYL